MSLSRIRGPRLRLRPSACLLAVVTTACSEPTGPQQGPAAPTLGAMSPTRAVAGAPGFVLSVQGSGFTETSRVQWNGQPRETRFVSAGALDAEITAADIQAAGEARVTVAPYAGGPGYPAGPASSALTFRVADPTDSIVEPALHEAGVVQAGLVVSCGISSSGHAHCWGENTRGTLGNGLDFGLAALEPEPVASAERFRSLTIGSRWQAGIAAQPICGLTEAGQAFCWGSSPWDPHRDRVPTPTPVATDLRFIRIDAGESHVCGLTEHGEIHCWGEGHDGELGDGLFARPGSGGGHVSQVPVRIAWPEPFGGVASGRDHACGLTRTGRALCWGRLRHLGVGGSDPGPTSDESVRGPTPVQGDVRFAALDAGTGLTCGLTAPGRTYCWGGFGRGPDALTPELLPAAPRFVALSVGDEHACGIDGDHALWCWGSNAWGQLGDGTVGGRRDTPVPVAGARRFAAVDAGVQHTCGVTSTGAGLCWGRRAEGRLGSPGRTDLRLVPTPVADGHVFEELTGRCGRTAAGAVLCWGPESRYAAYAFDAPRVPTALAGEPLVSLVGHGRVCGLTVGGTALCASQDRKELLPVPGTPAFVQLVAGEDEGLPVATRCGLTAAGAAWCWDRTLAAEPVPAPRAFESLAAGSQHVCGLDAEGAAWCWGSNAGGQIGRGGTDTCYNSPKSWPFSFPCALTAVRAAEGHVFERLDASGATTCGWTSGGERLCWGFFPGPDRCDGYGDYDFACTFDPSPPPPEWIDLPVVGLSGDILGTGTSCGVTSSGEARCWGENERGQVGSGTRDRLPAPPAVVQGGHRFLDVDPWGETTCGLTVDGTVLCWGWGPWGEIGDGGAVGEPEPGPVADLVFRVPEG